ncbi:hypothetical protein E2562_021767 [Oryza meyeriana var. granulata]|uniref:Uncharacterized protein n=1 Tax=Oryza meyeriana var. granulata TaxID=110450 RepID=A0A6G1EXW3_9ORYZ|nr:hypothetical protein E2562_021767 [Oryza meyeriana var. granulata]
MGVQVGLGKAEARHRLAIEGSSQGHQLGSNAMQRLFSYDHGRYAEGRTHHGMNHYARKTMN